MAGKITKEELHPLLSQKIDDFAAHEADKVQHIPYAVATGAANAYAVTLNPAPTSYVDGMAISVKINVTNTGSSTLNINGLGAKNILKADLNLITSGKLKAGGIYTFRYNAEGPVFILQGEGGEYGTAGAGQVLAGYTVGTEGGLVNGSIPNFTDNTQWATGATGVYVENEIWLRPPAGYYDGSVAYVRVYDPNWAAANILAGKSILGLAGTAINGAGMKKVATGTVAATGNDQTISGLDFTPHWILMRDVGNNSKVYWISFAQGVNATYINTGNILSVGNGYFVFNSYNAKTMNWIAIE
ncbi:hypothetical protein Dhaf_1427 [Desulfitobacterium hafniense DCB-2]|uniref:Uncharacterized protein n=3 Tax=root TaxID=1 RepID=G9XWC3_DESHA|nr:hypothetical protein [Desulfitobacterium hafniense]ACL19482.1 hypothetical protein Dhaf_1427 [Desulfitobacterium hafniense DCB-2]EHL04003.1 hypothetical protein HMPREF0322_05290 [Desulfitobacterium hafniense DP7]MEA5023564.1 hypothetical protein [Desulfitobacterium hafniense]